MDEGDIVEEDGNASSEVLDDLRHDDVRENVMLELGVSDYVDDVHEADVVCQFVTDDVDVAVCRGVLLRVADASDDDDDDAKGCAKTPSSD